jgi:hypothetical protein
VRETLDRHGIRLRDEVLDDADRDLWESVGLHRRRPHSRSPVKVQLDSVLERLEKVVRDLESG